MTKQELISRIIEYLEEHREVTDINELVNLHMQKGICYLALHVFQEHIYSAEWVGRLYGNRMYIGKGWISSDPKNEIELRIRVLKQELENENV